MFEQREEWGKGRASEFGDFELWKTGKRKRE
jgi:hypothetical protein